MFQNSKINRDCGLAEWIIDDFCLDLLKTEPAELDDPKLFWFSMATDTYELYINGDNEVIPLTMTLQNTWIVPTLTRTLSGYYTSHMMNKAYMVNVEF